MGRGGWACEGARVCPGMALISMHERALSVTALCHERRRFAAMEPLTPPKTHDESMGDLYRPHSASPTSPTAVITDARRAPHQAGSCLRVHHGPAVPLALRSGPARSMVLRISARRSAVTAPILVP